MIIFPPDSAALQQQQQQQVPSVLDASAASKYLYAQQQQQQQQRSGSISADPWAVLPNNKGQSPKYGAAGAVNGIWDAEAEYDNAWGHGMGVHKMHSSVPPPGYVCKLCFVEGHWLKNCSLYRERRHHLSQPFLMGQLSVPSAMGNDRVGVAANGGGVGLNSMLYGDKGYESGLNLVSPRGWPGSVAVGATGMGLQGYGYGTGHKVTTLPPDGYVCHKCNTPGH
ncbi:hypothetical protein HDU97_009436, partial [Phlyctochytrium planicorne]